MSESRKTLHEGRFLGLYEHDDWEYAERPHADSVVGILAVTEDAEIVLIEQFRHPVKSKVIEIPAGLVGNEPDFQGESLADCAKRELLEETGYRANSMEALMTSPTSAGMTSELTHLFFASDLTQEHAGGGIGDEDIKVHLVPVNFIDAWLAEKEAAGYLIDFKIHAALWASTKFEEH